MKTCPVCGTAVRIISSGEGTNYYQPIRDAELTRLTLLLDALESAFANWQSSGTREEVRKWDEKIKELLRSRKE